MRKDRRIEGVELQQIKRIKKEREVTLLLKTIPFLLTIKDYVE